MHHLVVRAARLALPVALLAAAGCGSSKPAAPSSPAGPQPPGTDGNTVNGTERIGWDQPVAAGSSPNEYTYSWYIDGLRAGAAAAACAPQGESTLSCAAPIPQLTPGTHQLRISATRTTAGLSLEGARSAPLTVVQTGSSAPALTRDAIETAERSSGTIGSAASGEQPKTADASERVSVIARGLAPVSDVAAAGGVVIVAERRGTLRAGQPGSARLDRVLVLADVVAGAPGFGLLAVAAHPDFADNHQVYFLYTAEAPSGVVYRVARAREVGGEIGEIAVLLDGVDAAPSGWATLRFGPDRKLYVAFAPAAGAARPGSYAGRVLRLNDDGSTPRDNAGSTPVIAETGGTPLALVWNADGDLGIVRALSDGRPDFRRSLGQASGVRAWRANEQPASAVYYRADLLPELSGRLLVGMMDGGLGLMDSPLERGGVTRRIGAAYGAARALAVGASGEIFVGTANGDLAARGAAPREDVLLMIRSGAR